MDLASKLGCLTQGIEVGPNVATVIV